MAKESQVVSEFRILIREEIKRILEMRDKDPVMGECGGDMKPNKRYGFDEADVPLEEIGEAGEGDNDGALEEFPAMHETDGVAPVQNEKQAEAVVVRHMRSLGYAARDISIDDMDDSEDDALEYSSWNVSVTDRPGSDNTRDWHSIRVSVYDGVAETVSDGDDGEFSYFNKWNQGDNLGHDEPQGYDDYDGYDEGHVRESDQHERSVDLEDELDAAKSEPAGKKKKKGFMSKMLDRRYSRHGTRKKPETVFETDEDPGGSSRRPKHNRADYVDDEDTSLSDLFDLDDEYGDRKNKYKRNPDPNEY